MKFRYIGLAIASVGVVFVLVWLTKIKLNSAEVSGAATQTSTANNSPAVTPPLTPSPPSPAPAPLALPPPSEIPKHVGLTVTRQKFISSVKANSRIEDVAFKYGLPEKTVGDDAAIWKCVDGEVIVKAYNHPGQVMQNDGSWKSIDDYRIKTVSNYP